MLALSMIISGKRRFLGGVNGLLGLCRLWMMLLLREVNASNKND
jgi:hypothetical protein